MKFLQTHRKDLLSILAGLGFVTEQFNFVKRKGRIHIVYQLTGESFAYFRRKATHLHPETKQWVESETFEVTTDSGKPVMVNRWIEVCQAFEAWLQKLENSGS